MAELTEAEHDALVQAVGEHCSHTGPVDMSLPHGCRDCDEIVRVDVAATVALIIAARQATAWDEGMEYGVGEFGHPFFPSDYARNPYRPKEAADG